MTKLYYILAGALLLSINSYSQCDGSRFREFVFSDVTITENIQYGTNLRYNGEEIDLLMDVYEPTGDGNTPRPLVVIAHGGFFAYGSKDGPDVVPLSTDLAKMGYVTASINYRLGFATGGELDANMTEAAMRGVQDMKAAIRWFRKDAAENGNTYNINTDEIYIAGVSAGGYITLHLAYLDQEAEIPTNVTMTNPGLEGGIEGLSGNDGYSSDVRAIVNMCGALGDTAWIQPGDEPALLFHGDEDQTVPFDSDTQYYLGIIPIIDVDGSNSINQKLDQVGVEHCFEIHEGYDHVPHVTNAAIYDTTLSIISNFLSHFVCEIELDCEYRELAVGVEESELAKMSVYPNPTSNMLFIKTDEPVNVRMTSILGSLIYSGKNITSIDCSGFSSGMYLLTIESKGKYFTTKIQID
jgi:acetyl esterase/lipase